VVVESVLLDDAPEWNNYYNENDPVGNRSNLTIRCGPSTAGQPLATSNKDEVHYERNNKRLSTIASDKSIALMERGFKGVEDMCASLRLPAAVVYDAKMLLTDISQKCCIRGNDAIGIYCAGAVYFACKMQMEEGISRSENEICNCIGVVKHKFNACLKNYRTHLADKPYAERLFVSLNATDILGRLCDNLASNKTMERQHKMLVRNTAARFIESIQSTLDGRPPNTLCAVGLAAAVASTSIQWVGGGQARPTRGDIALACDIKIGTLNKAIKMCVEADLSYPVLD
jgi:transcription initiation factor TFIIIB Brf1 subunit/transcription initiation factor TFIIB